MKKIFIMLLLCLVAAMPSVAQGVEFEKGVSLSAALERAKKENKQALLYCHTSWCGPCKIMERNTFPREEVGEFFNKYFVCVEFDMEEGEGVDICKRYNIRAFPTFVVLDAAGDELYRIVGGTNAKKFIESGRRALDPSCSLKLLDSEYESGGMSTESMMKYVLVLNDQGVREKKERIYDELQKKMTLEDRMSAAYWPIHSNVLITPLDDDNVNIVVDNYDRFKKTVGQNEVYDYIEYEFGRLLNNYYIALSHDVTRDTAVLERVKRQTAAIDHPDKDLLEAYAGMADAAIAKDLERFIELFEQFGKRFSTEPLMTADLCLRECGTLTKAQKNRVADILTAIAPHTGDYESFYQKNAEELSSE